MFVKNFAGICACVCVYVCVLKLEGGGGEGLYFLEYELSRLLKLLSGEGGVGWSKLIFKAKLSVVSG